MRKYILIAVYTIIFSSCTIYHEEVFVGGGSIADKTIRVMSYNVRHCSPPATGLIDIDATAAAINKQKPDVVALQEIDVNTGRSGKQINQAIELGKKTGMQAIFGKAIDHDGGEYGVAILSRHGYKNPKVYRLPTDEVTKGEHRVMLVAEVFLPNKKTYYFATTHLDAQGPETNRDLQIKEIVKLSKKIKKPFILAGDLNATPESGVIKQLDEHFTRSCEPCGFTTPATKPTKTIDYITFLNGSKLKVLSHEVIVEPKASDHAPILAVFGY
jgi:endonuclease/exonuclease/phosphatase family metal-dependent hydrolase